MNDLLLLKGRFEQKKGNNTVGPANIPTNKEVSLEHLIQLQADLINVEKFWQKESLKINPLISVYYRDVVAKSNRIKGILESTSLKNNQSMVGAKFSNDVSPKHIITHCIKKEVFRQAITNLDYVISIVDEEYGDSITHEDIKEINNKKKEGLFSRISRSRFVNILVDAYYVESFGVEKDRKDFADQAIVTLFDTGVKTSEIMKQLDIDFLNIKSIDETTILLSPDQYNLLKQKAPYLISMSLNDFSKMEIGDIIQEPIASQLQIPKPSNEPVIGVIDTMFDQNVYFSEWVEFKNMLDPNIELQPRDFLHGTQVSSLIVDGATLNPNLNDGCGRFRVKHFGVATSGQFSSFTVLRSIKEIVEKNKDIKVWNISLGSALEINSNFISPEADILDKIQYENDVVFVVAGTNKPKNSLVKKIGAPADSINSLVVNAVGFDNQPADYSREGMVLSFFNKPDVSYYGGDSKQGIRVYSPLGESVVTGTSFAAPWITRKMAYLIEVLGMTREVAKALIIDAAAGWYKNRHEPHLIGYGVVPVDINDIVRSQNDEIKFVINGTSELYDTYNYNLPVPESKEKQPFISKATLCYFPKCSRNQGVDYTNTEMDIHFGRIGRTKTGVKIDSIDDNQQAESGIYHLYEHTARKLYRKWDNIKHIRENLTTPKGRHKKPKTIKGNGLWGISIKTKERLNGKDGKALRFGLVVTLKEVNGINRIQEFIQQCQLRGWLVNRINVENQIDIYNKSEEVVVFE